MTKQIYIYSFLLVTIISSVLWGIGYPSPIRYPLYITCVALWGFGLKLKLSNKVIKWLNYIFIVLVISIFNSNLLFNKLYFSFLGLFLLFLYAMLNQIPKKVISLQNFSKALLIAVYINSIFLVIEYTYSKSNFLGGLYPEPSNLGYTLGPILAFLFFVNNLRIHSLINASITVFLSPSSTLLFGLIVFGILWLIRKKRPHKIFLLAMLILLTTSLLIVVLSLKNDYFSSEKLASSQVWLNGYKKAYNCVLIEKHYFGVGPFGWISQNGENVVLESKLLESNFIELNQRDLGSMIPFLLCSYGLLVIPIIIFVVYQLSKYDNTNIFEMMVSLLLLTYIVVFSFRWAGFVLSPFLTLVATYLYLKKPSCKKYALY